MGADAGAQPVWQRHPHQPIAELIITSPRSGSTTAAVIALSRREHLDPQRLERLAREIADTMPSAYPAE